MASCLDDEANGVKPSILKLLKFFRDRADLSGQRFRYFNHFPSF